MPSSIVSLIREGKRLHLPETGPVSELWERALQVVLEAEGPPHEPIPGISSEVRTAIARSPKGRPLYLCHSWETAGWTCLLLDLAPVVMGRPIFLKNPTGKGPGRAVTDYQSQKFQRRIGAACIALGLQPPGEPSRLCSRLDLGRLFLAWSPMEGATPPALKGDLDNYAKNIMDGLQRARIVTNDRTIASIGFSRETLPAPGQTLDELLIRDLLEVRARYPKLGRRALAAKARVSQRTCKRLLDLARAQAAAAAAETPPGGPIPSSPAPITPPQASQGLPGPQESPSAAGAGLVNPQEEAPAAAGGPALQGQGPAAFIPVHVVQPLSRDQQRQRDRNRSRRRPGRRDSYQVAAAILDAAAAAAGVDLASHQAAIPVVATPVPELQAPQGGPAASAVPADPASPGASSSSPSPSP